MHACTPRYKQLVSTNPEKTPPAPCALLLPRITTGNYAKGSMSVSVSVSVSAASVEESGGRARVLECQANLSICPVRTWRR